MKHLLTAIAIGALMLSACSDATDSKSTENAANNQQTQNNDPPDHPVLVQGAANGQTSVAGEPMQLGDAQFTVEVLVDPDTDAVSQSFVTLERSETCEVLQVDADGNQFDVGEPIGFGSYVLTLEQLEKMGSASDVQIEMCDVTLMLDADHQTLIRSVLATVREVVRVQMEEQ